MTDRFVADPPSAFVAAAAAALLPQSAPRRRALDVAMGRGRHALTLARSGWRVFGVDSSFDALVAARARAALEGLAVRAWCADLEAATLPPRTFDLAVVTRYLQRSLFDAIRETVVPRGVVVYETFTVEQRRLGRGPRSPEHLLEPGELRARFDRFEILFYEEVTAPEAVARLIARKGDPS
jgi:tellurite methyltransferase